MTNENEIPPAAARAIDALFGSAQPGVWHVATEVEALRRHVAACEADNTRLRALLEQSRLPHTDDCLTMYNPAYPCSCPARRHNARIDAALHESQDALSDSTESPTPQSDH